MKFLFESICLKHKTVQVLLLKKSMNYIFCIATVTFKAFIPPDEMSYVFYHISIMGFTNRT